jgi:flagellar motility protein MotE (MotC chaperone)
MDGLTTAGKYFGDQFAREMKNPQEVIEEALIPSLIKNRNALIENRNATHRFGLELQKLKLPDEIADIQAEAINFDTYEQDLKRFAAKGTISTINEFGGKFGDMLDETLEEFKKARIEKEAELTKFLEDNTGFDATRIEDFKIIGKDYIGAVEDVSSKHTDELRKLSAEDIKQTAVSRTQVEDALKQMGINGGKLERLVTQLEAGAVVQINVDMNSDKVADTMFQIHKKKGHFAVAKANP